MARKDKQKDLEWKRNYSRKYYKDPKHKIKHTKYVKNWYTKNREKMRQYSKEYWAKPEKKLENRKSWLKRAYGITPEAYQVLLDSQNGCCAICRGQEINSRRKYLSVDHNHATGKVRGLLCHHCNALIGYSKENVYTLQKALEYLEKYD